MELQFHPDPARKLSHRVMEVLCLNCYSDVLLKAALLEPDML
jgi:hypothetical protein